MMWVCRCQCGTEREVNKKNVKSGRSVSCGCFMVETNTTHGGRGRHHRMPEHVSWSSMINRCTNEKCNRWDDYGGRGITVCPEWQGPRGFEQFLIDMGERPSPEHTLDRYPDNDGGYCPENCRWATRSDQQRNKRTTKLIEFEGRSQSAYAWAEEWGMTPATFCSRRDRGYSMSQIKNIAVKRPRGNATPPTEERVIEYEGVEKTIREWAEEFGLPVQQVVGRLTRGWSMARIEATPRGMPRGKKGKDSGALVEYDGRSKTLTGWAEEFGMSYETLCSRRSAGWTMDRIRHQPVGVPRGKHVKVAVQE